MPFEHYIQSGGKRLRCGYTTGTCAALAAAGCARFLMSGAWPERVSLRTPKGLMVEVPLEGCRNEGKTALCGVRKDGGDDVDRTHGALIEAAVTLAKAAGIDIAGGPGIGRVTMPGLDQPVGAAAINRVPREMITRAVEDVFSLFGYEGGARVVISVPDGAFIAKDTFNPHLGVEGGISILGTSGIVEPMSVQAVIDTVALQIRQAAAQGAKKLIFTPGNYGLTFLREQGIDRMQVPIIKCSNFIGDALDQAVLEGFRQLLLVGHIGKLVKLAGGIFNTHSRTADCRTELFIAHAALCGGDRNLCKRLKECATADACLDELDRAGLREQVLNSLLEQIQMHLSRRTGENCTASAVLFSNVYGFLGETRSAKEMLEAWNTEKQTEPFMQ